MFILIMNIGIDIDDVLAQFNTSWLKYHNELYKTNYEFDHLHDYDYSTYLKLPGHLIVERIHDFYDTEHFKNLEVVEGSIEGIEDLSLHKLFVITSRPNHCENVTISWLDKYFPKKFNEIVFTNQFTRDKNAVKISKSEVAKRLGITYMVEDAIHHAHDLGEVGVNVLLLEKPWNREKEIHNKAKRLKHWREVKESLV